MVIVPYGVGSKQSACMSISAMRTHPDRAGFEKELAKNGIGILFRENEQGRIYGATFIDHEQKCVFNCSRLGKEFSANVFNDLFNGKHLEPIQQPKHDTGQSFEPFVNFRKEDDSVAGGLFSLLSPEINGTDYQEEAFALTFTRPLFVYLPGCRTLLL